MNVQPIPTPPGGEPRLAIHFANGTARVTIPEARQLIGLLRHSLRRLNEPNVPIKTVYVAGPLSVGDTAANVRHALQDADFLLASGFHPYVPHLSHFWHLLFGHPYDVWMNLDRTWLSCCDALFRLPGESPGADVEVAEAEHLGIPVFYTLSDLFAAAFAPAPGTPPRGFTPPDAPAEPSPSGRPRISLAPSEPPIAVSPDVPQPELWADALAIATDALYVDGGHHKQYALEQIIELLGGNLDTIDAGCPYEKGIPG